MRTQHDKTSLRQIMLIHPFAHSHIFMCFVFGLLTPPQFTFHTNFDSLLGARPGVGGPGQFNSPEPFCSKVPDCTPLPRGWVPAGPDQPNFSLKTPFLALVGAPTQDPNLQ